MSKNPRLPPVYSLVTLSPDCDPLAWARERALQSVQPATLFWIDSPSLFDCAVILEPDRPFFDSRLVLYAGMLGLGDAIGSVVPAGIDITYRWPNRIEANVGIVGQVRLSAPAGASDDAIPPWLILRAMVAVAGDRELQRSGGIFETTLEEEGAADVTTTQILESYSRHLLNWISRWQDDGFEPIRSMWLRHSDEKHREITIAVGEKTLHGVFEDIDETGALRLKTAAYTHRIPVDDFIDR